MISMFYVHIHTTIGLLRDCSRPMRISSQALSRYRQVEGTQLAMPASEHLQPIGDKQQSLGSSPRDQPPYSGERLSDVYGK